MGPWKINVASTRTTPSTLQLCSVTSSLVPVLKTSSTYNPATPQTSAILDSGCTDTAVRNADVPASIPITITTNPLLLETAKKGTFISSKGTCQLPCADIELHAHVFDDSELSTSLVSVHDITAHDIEVRMDKRGTSLYRNGLLLDSHPKDVNSKLYPFNLCPDAQPAVGRAASAISLRSEKDIVNWAHACFGSPPASTFYRASLNGWFNNYPSLTPGMIHRHWPNTLATAQGHLQRQRQGIRSTHPSTVPESVSPLSASTDDSDSTDIGTSLHYKFFDRHDAMFADAAGRFPEFSRHGSEYMLIFVFKNYIHVECMESRSAQSFVKAFTDAFTFFKTRNNPITSVVIDNETSADLKQLFLDEAIDVQTVPPGDKRSNKAERCIQSWRNHFLSVLGTVSSRFPTNLWEDLVPQMELTLAHLRPFADDSKLSSWEGIHGHKYDFLAHPISTCGTKVYVFESNDVRDTWDCHGQLGFYVGPALDSYRSYKCHVTSTNRIRTSNTVQFFPEDIPLPATRLDESIATAVAKLTSDHKNRILDLANLLLTQPQAAEPNEPDTHHIDTPPPEQRVSADVTDTPVQRVQQRVPIPETPTDTVGQRVQNPMQQGRRTRNKQTAQEQNAVTLRKLTTQERKTTKFQKYLARIGQRWCDRDDMSTFAIVDVMMPKKSTGPSSKTPQYIYYDVNLHESRPSTNDTEQTRCSELENSSYVEWLPREQTANSIRSKEPYDGRPLNQQADGSKITMRSEIAGPRSEYWRLGLTEEIIRLLDSSTLLAVHRSAVPSTISPTYFNPQVKEKLASADGDQYVDYRVRGTYGGNNDKYAGPRSSQTADYATVKLLLNSVVSDIVHKNPNTRFATADMVDYYLGTPLEDPNAYVVIEADTIGDQLIDIYHLNDHVYTNKTGKRMITFRLAKAMYGYPAAGLLSFKRLKTALEAADFYEHPIVDCLFLHKTRSIVFALIVDDMGIKFDNEDDLQYLLSTIGPHWKVKLDRSGTKFLGMTLQWKYELPLPEVTLSAPTTIPDALAKFCKHKQMKGKSTPSPYTQIHYGSKVVEAPIDDDSPAPPGSALYVQEVTGTLGHHSRVIDYALLEAVTSIARTQAAPTVDTMNRVEHLLQYAFSHQNHAITFVASEMIVTTHTDASYQSIPFSRSKLGGIHYCGNKNDPPTKLNGLFSVKSKIIPIVCAGASDAEYGAAFTNCQDAYFFRIVVEALGYPQPPTPIYIDNDVARGIGDRTVKVKRSRSIEKCFHWLRDRIAFNDFELRRVSTKDNVADYFTKSVTPQRHDELIPFINKRL